MKVTAVALLALFLSGFPSQPALAKGHEFKKWEAQIAEYKRWLDSLGPNGARFWIKLDEKGRPHKLYLGEGFYRAKFETQKLFVETFSSYLAGHPEKAVLVDLFDAATGRPVGEYGWGGFKLYPDGTRRAESSR